MGIKILTQFQLKMTLIGEAIAKNVILPQISTFLGSNFVTQIAKFERISKFSDLNHGNTTTGQVSSQNDPNW